MRYGKKVIGATLYRRLREDVLVHINGKDVTRQMLIERFKCGNFAVVKNLAKAAHDHGIDLDHLSAFDQFEALAMVPGVGPTTLYVAMCLMSASDADKVVKQVHVTLPTFGQKAKKKEA